MTITSLFFLVFVALGALIYYLCPGRFQWIILLIMSVVFYVFAATPYTIVYLLISTLSAYVATILFSKRSAAGKKSGWLLVVSMSINIGLWFVLKGNGLWQPILPFTAGSELIASLGMGYYTLQVLGYTIDCYWENIEPQKNPVKLFLFVSFFPQLTTGPISRYSELTSLYSGHKFDYEKLTFGAQRILWGFFKKLVLADRAGIIVSTITSALADYTGFYSWLAILIYPIQMYADFSGCMDIVIGVAEIFGITLPENFNNPFFSRSSQEFWQRWHITLGTWAKDYVLYPLLKTKVMVKFGKKTKKAFGKKWGKFVATSVGMLVLWLVMGIWHGGYRFIVGVSLWYWIILMAGDILEPVFAGLTRRLNIKVESFSWHFFQSARTYLIYAIGATFFSVGVAGGLSLIKSACMVFFKKGVANPWIFFDGSLSEIAGSYGNINLIIFGILLLIIVGILREKYGFARTWMKNQGVVFRWLIWIGLFILVLVYGSYGPGYDASAFIYQAF